MTLDARWDAAASRHPYPLLFLTASGAHLYGFASPDSDVDLRGSHVAPLERVVGLAPPPETVERHGAEDGLDVDFVTHEARKFLGLLLRPNGYVLEQLTSPLVVRGGPAYEELLALAPRLATRRHEHHYRGFAKTQWDLFDGERPRRVKPLLYVYRVVLTGIHLMRTGRVEANLPRLLEETPDERVSALVRRKAESREGATLRDGEEAGHRTAVDALLDRLGEAAASSPLPVESDAHPALDDLLVRLRLGRVALA